MEYALDTIDLQILRALQENARLTTKELAARVNLSTTPVFERMKRLEKGGLIKKYVAEHGDWTVDREGYNNAVKLAAYEAGKRRMVPIFLTTATTAVGVVPMIIAQSSFWMPVGVTIFAGGIGSLIMVVTMLPVIYWKVSLK